MKTHIPATPSSSREIFRRICAGGFVIISILLGQLSSHAALLIDDPFNYTAGNLNGQGTWSSSGSVPDIQVAAGSLSVAGLAAPSGNKINWSGTGRNSYKAFAGPASGTIYFSFVLRANATPGTAALIASLNSASTTKRQCIHLGADGRLGLSHNAGTVTYGGSPLSVGTDYLVVGSLEIVGGSANDIYRLWVAPEASAFGGTEPAVSAQMTSTSDTTFTSARFYFQRDANTPSVDVDELRVGVSWAEVTPSGGPLVGTKLGFTTQPAGAAPGATMSPVIVQVQTSGGASVPSNGVPVTLSLTGGSGTLNGTLTQNTDGTGKATFSDLSIDTAGIGKQLTATASGIGAGLTDAVSSAFTIIAQPVATKLGFVAPPTDGVVNTTLPGITVQIQDANSLSVASNGVPITLTLSSGSGNLLGTTTRNTDGTGKAVFNDLSIDDVGTKQITATASGTSLTDAVSAAFEMTLTPVGKKLTFTTQPSSTPAGGTLNNVAVQIQDNNSAAVASNGVPITLTLTLGTGTLSGTTTQNTDGTGKATFSGLSINVAGAAKQLTATASGIGTGLTSGISSIFAITGPSASGAPVITQTVMAASSMILRGTNGVPGGEYRVLSSTNVATPMAQWATIQTNTYRGNGTFDSTNLVSSSIKQAFFRLTSAAGSDGGQPDFSHFGFADRSADGGVYALTGGTNGSFPPNNIVIASNYATLGAAISNPAPLIILVQGEIFMRTNGNFYCRSDKTIIGVGTNATLVGCLALYGNASGGEDFACSNIIIRNITFRNPDQFGEDDGITIKYGTHHIWVDHCTFHDIYDGSLDVTRESDFVTVSWCKFFYNSVNAHGDTVNLIGGSDTDSTDLGKLHVTFHHNWWGPLCRERMPSVRFGRVHIFNSYFASAGNHYCCRARLNSEVLVENNYFDNVYNPWEIATSSAGPNGKLRAVGNVTNNCTFSTSHYDPNLPSSGVVLLTPGDDVLSTNVVNHLNPPPYSYTPDAAINVPATVQEHGGAGKGPFAP